MSWGQEEIEAGRRVDDRIEPILAGTLDDLEWKVIPTASEPELFALVVDGREQGRTPYTTPTDPALVEIDITSLPGGVVVFGHAPPEAGGLLLHTRSRSVSLPLAPHQSDRNAFAVPIEDAIDPLYLEFLDDEGQSLGIFPLDQYPAYLIGYYGTGLRLTID